MNTIFQNKENNQIIQYVVNDNDLKLFFREIIEEWNQEHEQKEETYLTTAQTSEMLNVDKSTLWRWNNTGYLKVIKVGNKSRYKLSDVERIKKGGC